MSYHDPRTELTRDVTVGDVYTDTRSDEELRVVYEDEDVVLCKTDYYRLDARRAFEENVGAGRYDFDHTTGQSLSTVERSLEERIEELESKDGYKAKHKATGIRIALDMLGSDTTPIEFEEIDGVGQKTADTLRANGISTVKDVQNADDNDLLTISGVGESNLRNIKEVIR